MASELNGRWECTEGTSNKFYEIRYQRNSDTYLCTFGPIGSSGQESEQEHDFVLKKHRAFAGKGYRLVRGSNAVSNEAPRITPARPVKEEPTYTKSRLASIDDEDEPVKPKEKKNEEPKSRLSSVD